jgi:hypothetical protein
VEVPSLHLAANSRGVMMGYMCGTNKVVLRIIESELNAKGIRAAGDYIQAFLPKIQTLIPSASRA